MSPKKQDNQNQDSLSTELGPCNVTANLTSEVNPYSWSEVSNMLFLSQPLGVGFSYGNEQAGTLNPCKFILRLISSALYYSVGNVQF